MTGMDAVDALAAMAAQFADAALPFSDPEGAAARATAEPMAMYVERAARCPVERLEDDYVVLLRMADILYVNKHHDVEQASKYLGSNRPAIPLGLDGAEHRKYRRLLDPVFTAQARRAAGRERAHARRRDDRHVRRRRRGRRVRAAGASRCRRRSSSRSSGCPLADLDDFLHFKSLTLGNEFATLPFDEAMARREEAVVWIHDYFNRLLDDRLGARRPGRRPARVAPHDRGRGRATAPRGPPRHPRAADDRGARHRRRVAGAASSATSPAIPTSGSGWSADPSLWPSAIEELMRFESPVTDGGRIALADLDLPSGEHIAAGTPHGHLVARRQPRSRHSSPTRSPSTSAARRTLTSRSPAGSTAASVRTWRAWRCTSRSRSWHQRIPDYEIAPGSDLTYSGNPRAPHHLTLTW